VVSNGEFSSPRLSGTASRARHWANRPAVRLI